MKLDIYNACRPDMKSGDMIEFASDTVIGSIIRSFSKQKVNHTALVLNLDRYEGLKRRRFVLEAVGSGVQLVLLSKTLEGFKGRAYLSRLKPEYDLQRGRIAAWAIQQAGTKYDYSGLFANMFGRVNQDVKKFFCSEYYQMALTQAGILPKGWKALRPGEFAQFDAHLEPIKIIDTKTHKT